MSVDRRLRTAPHGDALAGNGIADDLDRLFPFFSVPARKVGRTAAVRRGVRGLQDEIQRQVEREFLVGVAPATDPPRLVSVRREPGQGLWTPAGDTAPSFTSSPWTAPVNVVGGELTRGQFLLVSAQQLARYKGVDVGQAFADLIDSQDRAAKRTRYATITRRSSTGAAIPFVVPVPANVIDADEWFRDDTACANGMGC
jgi:hypothetical protein